MSDSTSRIERATSFREPDSQTPLRPAKEGPRPRPSRAGTAVAPSLAPPEEEEKHQLDTLA